MKIKKRRYKLETSSWRGLKKEFPSFYTDVEAINYFLRVLRGLKEESTIVLYAWYKEMRQWEVLRKGGYDPPNEPLSGKLF